MPRPSSAPGGYGHLNHGYRRIQHNGKRRYEHQVVWESTHGPIAKGMIVHHKDENRLNNALDNLELLSIRDHIRLHLMCEHGLTNRGASGQCRPCAAARERARRKKCATA